MHRRPLLTTLIAIFAFAASTSAAFAATSSQIHRDAADGSIDGNYTLAEMRAADRTVGAEQREYGAWDDVYAAYLRQQANPDDIAPVPPVDADQDGTIEPAERAAAEKKTRAKCTKATAAAKRSSVCRAAGVGTVEAEPDEDDGSDDETPARDSSKKDDDDTSPLIWIIAGVPLLVVAIGAWRMRRGRGKGTPAP